MMPYAIGELGQGNGLAMVWHRTVGRLFGAKPLPEPMLTYCQAGRQEQISVNLNQHAIVLNKENALEDVIWKLLRPSVIKRSNDFIPVLTRAVCTYVM